MTSHGMPQGTHALRGLHASDVPFAECDGTGRLVDANDAFARLVGATREELLAGGATWRDLTPPECHASDAAELAAARCSGFLHEHRTQLLRLDGSRLDVTLALLPPVAVRGGHAVLVLDDSERRSPERMRRESWRMYRRFLDSAPDLVVLRDAGGRILWANRAFLEVYRTRLDAIVGSLAPPGRATEANERELSVLAQVRETGETVELPPEPIRRASGEQRYFYTTCQPFPHLGLERGGTLSVSRDATARARAEQALARSEANLRTAQAIARIGSWELHFPTRGDDYWSEETFHILGLDPRQAPYDPERYVEELVHPGDRAAARDALRTISPQAHRFDQEYRIVRPDGNVRWVKVQASLLRNAAGDVERMVGTMRDVTEQKEADAVRERLESRLRQAQRLEAMGTLAGGIAHDFNNILGALSGYAELALEATRHHPGAQADLQQVLLAASRGADLVSRILTFSRQQEVPRTPIHPAVPVRDALKLLRATMPESVVMQESIDEDTPWVLGDETQILQVVMNLGANALHAMQGRGGTLHVRVDPFVMTPELAQDTGLSAELHARITVSDTGTGVPPQLRDRIFEPFFTTKSPGIGTGLGLSVVHGIVRDHGGALEVESVPDAGTTVTVYLPARGALPRGALSEGTEMPRGRGQRILVVDDEQSLAELERRRLEELGYVPLAFSDARRALAAFRSQPDRFDLVYTDLSMPHLTGVDLAREVRALRPDLPVLLVSGHGDTVGPEKLEESGIRLLLAKPVDRQRLAVAVASALARA